MKPGSWSALSRRSWLQGLAGAGVFGWPAKAVDADAPSLDLRSPPREEIIERITAARPLKGGAIPGDFSRRLGIAHAGAKYHLSEQPILVEGAERILACGPTCGKFWLSDLPRAYRFHSDWSGIDDRSSFVDRIRHPYFSTVLGLPFTTVALQVGRAPGTGPLDAGGDFSRDEDEMRRLAAFLLETYADKPCTFILQNWEGDWLVRGEHKDWSKGVPPGGRARLDGLAAWWRARQRGVTRAREGARADCRCRVLHAAEVNRVADGLRGIPVAATHALPEAPVDLVSWSSYDGISDGVRAWQCLDLLEHTAVKEGGGKPPVMIGEVGIPETGRSQAEVVEAWDRVMGVFLARDVSWIMHWALYCNESREREERRQSGPLGAADLRGFWWIRPDGSTSWGGGYLQALIAHAGRKLADAIEGLIPSPR